MVTRQHEVPLNFARLKEKQRSVRDDFPESLTLRVHRAISWSGRAEKEVDDTDVRFVLLWIGFNSVYGSDVNLAINGERGAFKTYFVLWSDWTLIVGSTG